MLQASWYGKIHCASFDKDYIIVSFPPWIEGGKEIFELRGRGVENFERQGRNFLGGYNFSVSGKGELIIATQK